MIRSLVLLIHDLYRYLQWREVREQNEEEDEILRQEHRERLQGIPPHLRSTRLRRLRRPWSNAELLLFSSAVIGIPGFLLLLLMFACCLVRPRLH